MVGNLLLRIISSAVMFAIVGVVIFLGDAAFYVAVLIVSLLSYNEWLHMTQNKSVWIRLLGNLVVLLPASSMIYIYHADGRLMFWMLIAIWSNDIGAYFVGKKIGKMKLCAKISPNKTVEGLVGGIFCSVVVGSIFLYFSGSNNFFSCVVLSPILPVIATIGDLFESFIKRICEVKDSSNIIPGHGGILDRVDSFIFVAPFVAWIIFMFKI